MKVVITMMLSALLVSGCASVPSAAKPELQDEGEIFVYVQPFPEMAAGLRFTIDQCSVINRDGAEIPLSLALPDISLNAVRKQRFFGAVRVPPGQYSGISCRLKKAELAGVEGKTTLIIPEEPVRINLLFEVRLKRAVVLSLEYDHAASIQSGFRFKPQFILSLPSLPATGLFGYAVNRDDNTITVFDKKTGQVSAMIATGKGPESIAIDETIRNAYVSLGREDAVDVIDMIEGSATHRINLNIGDEPRDLSITPDRRFVLTLNAASRTLSILDPVLLIELGRVPLEEGPRNLLIGPGGNRCYVFNGLSNSISIIDIANRAIVDTIPTEAGPLMGQFNRKGDRLYVIHEASPYLLVIDPASLSIRKRVFVGTGMSYIKVDAATDLLYASRHGDVRIETYDPLSLVSGDSFTATTGIVHMAIDDETNNLFLLSAEKKKLISVSLISRKIVSETDTGENPSWVTMMGER